MRNKIWLDFQMWYAGLKQLRVIRYKPGWGPYSFLLPYCTTYLAATLCGYGVISLSRVWYIRSFNKVNGKHVYFFSAMMTKILDKIIPGLHGARTGGWLWGTESHRKL